MKSSVLLLLAVFAMGCASEKNEKSTQAASVKQEQAETTVSDLTNDVNAFKDYEKVMRGFGVDLEEKWELSGGAFEPKIIITLENRVGDQRAMQDTVLKSYIELGKQIFVKHKAVISKIEQGSLSTGVGFVRYLVEGRIACAKEALRNHQLQ